MSSRSSAPAAGEASGTSEFLEHLLDRDPRRWLTVLDRRYGALDEVLDGQRQAVIYPAGRMAREAAAGLRSVGAKVVAFGDGDPARYGTDLDGLPVLSPDEIGTSHFHDAVLIASTLHDSAIRRDLLARGCEAVIPVGYLNLRLPRMFPSREYDGSWHAATDPANRAAIQAALELLDDQESRRVYLSKLAYYVTLDKRYLDAIRSRDIIYFDPSVFNLGSNEIVVDGGAFVGDTLAAFLRRCSGRFRAYYAFEPDPENYQRLVNIAATDAARITAVQAGLSGHESNARLTSTHRADSALLGDDEPGGTTVQVVGLDGFFSDRETPTLIKMDIEGAEPEALLGAAGILASGRPTLAVSAYHHSSDLWSIPLLIGKLTQASKLGLRHYTGEVDDTVCYAVSETHQSTT